MRKVGLVFFAVIFLFSLSPSIFADDPHQLSGNPSSSQNQQGASSSQTSSSTYLPYMVWNYFQNLSQGGNGVTPVDHGARAADNLERVFGDNHQPSSSSNAATTGTNTNQGMLDELDRFLSEHQNTTTDDAARNAAEDRKKQDQKTEGENHINSDGTCPPGTGGPAPVMEKKNEHSALH